MRQHARTIDHAIAGHRPKPTDCRQGRPRVNTVADPASTRPLNLAHHSFGLLQNLISASGYAVLPRAFMS